MKETSLKASADLQKFIDKFEPKKFKHIRSGIEVRGALNLPNTIAEAKELILHLRLDLVVFHSAEMLAFRGFEVNYR